MSETYPTPGQLAARLVGKIVKVGPRYVAPQHAFAPPTYERDEWTYRDMRAIRASADGDVLLTRDLSGADTEGEVWIRVGRLHPQAPDASTP